MGIFFFQLPYERVRSHYFPDGHGMHPYGACALDHPHDALAKAAEFLGQAPPILGHGYQFEKHKRRQNNGRQDQKYIVNDIHEVTS